MSIRTGRLAIDEFTFRYLAPENASGTFKPLDAIERGYQAEAASAGDGGATIDIGGLFRDLVLGKAPRGSERDRVLANLLQVHQPATVTPLAGYGVHASYPSPRAYYPLRFRLVEIGAQLTWRIDTHRLRLRPLAHESGTGAPDGSGFAIEIQNDFEVYAPLYNLFRKALFALESGHFVSEFIHMARESGMRVTQQVTPRAVRLTVHDESERGDISPAFRRHQRFSRERNSGRFYRGFFPASFDFSDDHLAGLLGAITTAIGELGQHFPIAARLRLNAKLCLRAGDGIPAGVHRLGPEGLECIDPHDRLDAFERLYNYDNFNFRTVPAVVFLCVDKQAYNCTDAEFLEMNMALGYVSQQLIRQLHQDGVLGRPFRSYDQLGTDRLLGNDSDGVCTYYGLMVAKNRYQDALGVLR